MGQVAEHLGVREGFILRQCKGACSGGAKDTQRHNRFAAACALAAVLEGQPVLQVVAKWGACNGLTERGVLPGQLQHLQ
eukprot:gene10387-12283_t